MTPQYREMLLNEKPDAVSNLSADFLSPPLTKTHSVSRNYESTLVVEFLDREPGLDALNKYGVIWATD